MDQYENKKVYGGKNFINALIELSHEERDKLNAYNKKMRHKTINFSLTKLIKIALKDLK